jgi:hypothetical protein
MLTIGKNTLDEMKDNSKLKHLTEDNVQDYTSAVKNVLKIGEK